MNDERLSAGCCLVHMIVEHEHVGFGGEHRFDRQRTAARDAQVGGEIAETDGG